MINLRAQFFARFACLNDLICANIFAPWEVKRFDPGLESLAYRAAEMPGAAAPVAGQC